MVIRVWVSDWFEMTEPVGYLNTKPYFWLRKFSKPLEGAGVAVHGTGGVGVKTCGASLRVLFCSLLSAITPAESTVTVIGLLFGLL